MHLENHYMILSVAAEPLIQIKDKKLMEASFQHLLSFICALTTDNANIAGGDAVRGHTRSHPEHDG